MAVNTPQGQPLPLAEGEFVNSSVSDLVTWAFKKVAPPSPVYITRDDQISMLGITTSVGETLTVNGRLLTIDGVIMPFQVQLNFPTAGVNQTKVLTGVEGFILSLSVVASQATQFGISFARLWINRGLQSTNNLFQVLVSGYCTTQCAATWPGQQLQYTRQGPGELRTVTITNPAAGADFTFNNGGSVLFDMNVYSVCATLTTSAAVANRQVEVQVTDGSARVIYRAAAPANITASSTVNVCLTTGQLNTGIITTDLLIPLPVPCLLFQQYSIKIVTTNLQGADQWSNIAGHVEKWVFLG